MGRFMYSGVENLMLWPRGIYMRHKLINSLYRNLNTCMHSYKNVDDCHTKRVSPLSS